MGRLSLQHTTRHCTPSHLSISTATTRWGLNPLIAGCHANIRVAPFAGWLYGRVVMYPLPRDFDLFLSPSLTHKCITSAHASSHSWAVRVSLLSCKSN